jgi:MinD-like ATPase involved in chromosome partitioning or flagellar assembly
MDFPALKEQVEATYQVPVAGMLPLNEEMIRLASSGLFVLEYPHHAFAREIGKIARQLA